MPEPLNDSAGDPGNNDDANNQQGGNGQQGGGQTDDGLGDAGKRAIEAERQARRQAERRISEMEKELARIRESGMSEQEKAVEQAKREAKAEAQKAFNTRLVQAEVRAAAAGKLADPEDAIRFIDLTKFDVDDEGKVDNKAITKEITDLVKARPYLAASATRPTGDADQGARGGSAGGDDMNAIFRNAFRR